MRTTEFAAWSLLMPILLPCSPELFLPMFTPLLSMESVQSASGCFVAVYLQLRPKQAQQEISSAISVKHSLKVSLKDLLGQHHFLIRSVIHHIGSGCLVSFRSTDD